MEVANPDHVDRGANQLLLASAIQCQLGTRNRPRAACDAGMAVSPGISGGSPCRRVLANGSGLAVVERETQWPRLARIQWQPERCVAARSDEESKAPDKSVRPHRLLNLSAGA